MAIRGRSQPIRAVLPLPIAVTSASVTADFTGSGTLTASVATAGAVTADFTGTGILTATVVEREIVTASFTGSGTFTAATVEREIVTASFAGSGTLSASVIVAGAFTYGAAVSASGRYLVDQNGNPWALRMISPWALMAWFTQSECISYMSSVAALGFNSVGINLVLNAAAGGGHTNADLKNKAGQSPFVSGDITNLTSTYWATVDAIVDAANAVGITPVLLPFGHSTGDNGGGAGVNSFPAFAGKTTTDCQAYGALIGARYASSGRRVLWMFGGDYVPVTNEPWDGSTVDLQMRACLTGIRSAGNNAPFTIELSYDYSFPEQNQFWERELNGDSGPGFGCGYSYDASYAVVWDEYHWTTQTNQWPGTRTRPAIFIEGNYWGENIGGASPGAPTTEETIRRQVLWPMTFGSPGWSYGDNNWDGQLGSGAWNDYLSDTPPVQINDATDYVVGFAKWHLMVPTTSLITSGAGTLRVGEVTEDVLENDYATQSVTPDGTLAMIYVPSAGGYPPSGSSRTITVNTALLGANPVATWYNPVTSATTSAGAGPSYTTPAAHADGTRDYLLVITADAHTVTASFTGSGTLTAAVVEREVVTASFTGTGVLSASVVEREIVTAGFTGSGSLTAAVVPVVPVAASFTGTGVLSAAVSSAGGTSSVNAAFTGTGTLTVAVVPVLAVTGAFTGSGTLSAAVVPVLAVAAGFTGSGTLSATVATSGSVAASFTGSGTLSATVVPVLPVAAGFTGAGSLTASVSSVGGTPVVTASFTGAGSLSATVVERKFVTAGFTGTGTLTAFAANAAVVRDITCTASIGTHSWIATLGDPVQISTLSLEYVAARVDARAANGSPAVVFDTQQVHLGLVPVGTAPQLSDFYPAEWVGLASSRRWCRMLIGPGGGVATYAAGVYQVHVRIVDTPEAIVQKVGGTESGQVTFA